jgi:D-arabinose 1-dehydrogenase-like Zn-dependent alcohol dehydrogenase
VNTAPAFVWTGRTESEVHAAELSEDRHDRVRLNVGYTGLCGLAGELGRARPGIALGHEVVDAVADRLEELT